jgi:NADH-quinone oxidoreductase subunit C
MNTQQVLEIVSSGKYAAITTVIIVHDQVVLSVSKDQILPLFQQLKQDSTLQLDMLLSVTVVDWLDLRGKEANSQPGEGERFQMVYHLRGIRSGAFLRIKAWVPEEDCEVESLTPLWKSANFMEREAWDMYGITFRNHPDLRRILMYDEFKGHPLRKDYPVQAKQPRIPLRAPEVRNTAMDMRRPDLVQISRKKAG